MKTLRPSAPNTEVPWKDWAIQLKIDNPFSEAQFKTFKYRPDFPQRFGCIEDAHTHCQQFFPWYNDSHRHLGIG